jgi:hypothetical protein
LRGSCTKPIIYADVTKDLLDFKIDWRLSCASYLAIFLTIIMTSIGSDPGDSST